MRSKPTWLVLLSLVLASVGAADDPKLEVNVNVAFTPEGRKVAPPTHDKPAYYFPVVGGYREEGDLTPGEKKPESKPIVHLLATTLARQGYFVVSPDHPQPSILLVFFWGYINPQIDDVGTDPSEPQKLFYNQKDMVALLGGQTLGNLDLDFEREAVMQGAEDNRYFVLVSAYDFAAARQHKKVLLWQARMSTPSGGVTLDEVIPALITGGGPFFGHETARPQWVDLPVARQGKVEIGTPTVVPDAAATKPAPEKK